MSGVVSSLIIIADVHWCCK